jgi:hypothetical protein
MVFNAFFMHGKRTDFLLKNWKKYMNLPNIFINKINSFFFNNQWECTFQFFLIEYDQNLKFIMIEWKGIMKIRKTCCERITNWRICRLCKDIS